MYANTLNENSYGAKSSNSGVDGIKDCRVCLIEDDGNSKVSLFDNLDRGVEKTIWFLYDRVGFDGLKIFEDENGDKSERLDDGLEDIIGSEFDCLNNKKASVALLRSVYHGLRKSRILLVNEGRLTTEEKFDAREKKLEIIKTDPNLRYGDMPECVREGVEPFISYQFGLKLDEYPRHVIENIVGVILNEHEIYLKCRIKDVSFNGDL